jgi:hypothetical protein
MTEVRTKELMAMTEKERAEANKKLDAEMMKVNKWLKAPSQY